MKRHKSLQSLSQEHHHGLMLAQLIKSGSPEYKGLPNTVEGKVQHTIKFFEENLVPHFNKEEKILFTISKNKNAEIDRLINELIFQHKAIYSLVDKLRKSSEPEIELNELGMLLESHIRKEERELFQGIQNVLSESEMEKLEKDLGESSTSCKV